MGYEWAKLWEEWDAYMGGIFWDFWDFQHLSFWVGIVIPLPFYCDTNELRLAMRRLLINSVV